jgi:predicted dehydrogenase/threonine dehydrogenase-like Zn-dependent dehydrogenase
MKQAFINKGSVTIHNLPNPSSKDGCVKIKLLFSTISVGTEITTVKGTGKSIFQRALDDPKKALQVLDILKRQGLKSAKSKVAGATEKLSAMGYSVSGIVAEVGKGVNDFAVGDEVSAGGSGFALHAEYVVVPKNLVVKIPRGLDMKDASTGTVGSIALHGVRRAELRLGEYAVVVGTGLLGLLALQMLKASGVKVACTDINNRRLQLAKDLGADLIVNALDEDPVNAVQNWSGGYGADAVLFMAATDKDEPLSQAFRMCRRKGRVVLVGISGMNINRNDIYRDEIDFMISSSYGPGRYDDNYELKGHDYPYAYVRWTENRNISAYLDMLKDGKINLDKLTPRVYAIDDAEQAYRQIENDSEGHILTMLAYDTEKKENNQTTFLTGTAKVCRKDKITIGLIGAGSFATSTLLPIIHKHSDKFFLKSIQNSSGDKALNAARLFKAENVVSEPGQIFTDPEIDLVMICTRHSSHAKLVLESLKNGKHVFVEKPLAINQQELDEISQFYNQKESGIKPLLLVGYNRRFSQHAQEIKKKLINRSSPVLLRYRMNAGFVPYDSWVHEDGGRIIGEACHIIDLMLYLTNSEVNDYAVSALNTRGGRFKSTDNRSISLTFKDGSVAVIDYFSCGSKEVSKECLEVHFDNKSIIMDDYKSLKGYGIKVKELKTPLPAKGHEEEWIELYKCLKEGNWPIPIENIIHTTKISFLVAE